jgi:Cdc6-like AAA superfamily ATPase
VIANARALKEDILPEELVHRGEKFDLLMTALQSLDPDTLGDDARIYGPSGAGKTTMAKMAAREIEAQLMSVETAHVDCLSHSTTTAALHHLCASLEIDGGLAYRSSSVAEYRDALAGLDRPVLVLVDEADHLDCLDLIHVLYELPHVATITISNREESLLKRADDRTASRLRSGVRIQLDAYSDQQLVDILERRVASGLVENIVDDDALWAMARRSEGNAREAIWHLRFGIKHVRAGNADRVTTGVVDETSTLARADLVRKVFSRLDREHRVICEVLFEHGELGASELHDELVSTLGESMSPRKRQRLVSKILDGSGYDLVAKSGKGPSTSYRLTDRTRELFESGELP